MEQQEQQTIEPKCDYLIPNISTYHVFFNQPETSHLNP